MSIVVLGLMGDQVGNYVAAFLMAGGVGILASLIPFLLLCLKRELNTDSIIEEVENDQERNKDVARRDKDELDHVGEATMDNKPHQKAAFTTLVIESTI